MSAALFLVGAVPPSGRFTLDGDEGHHAATVARMRPGEVLLLGDGRGTLAEATVVDVGRGTLEVELTRRWFDGLQAPRLVVAQGIAKGERGELAVQAMTEVGVDEILPWAASRSIVRWREERGDRSRQRWIDTARESTKQARRAWLPLIPQAQSTEAVIGRFSTATAALILHEDARIPLSTVPLSGSGELLLVVGPEGGIAPEELTAFVAAGATPVRLGRTVLRTSTAGVAALSLLNARLGRW
jgi:16S rRNA (uracil1498-N3)-methyltransferase